MRPRFRLLVCCACLLVCGCSWLRPSSKDYGDYDDDSMPDEWSIAKKEGRGATPDEEEIDGLSSWIESPQSLRIQRNLGYK